MLISATRRVPVHLTGSGFSPIRDRARLIIFVLGLALATVGLAESAEIHVGQTTASPGEIAWVPVNLVNTGSSVAVELHLTYDPIRLSVQSVLLGSAAAGAQLDWSQPAMGELTAVVYRDDLAPLATGEILLFSFQVFNGASPGNAGVSLSEAILSDAAAQLVTVTSATSGGVTVQPAVGARQIPTLDGIGTAVFVVVLSFAALILIGRGRGTAFGILILLFAATAAAAPVASPGDANGDGLIDSNDVQAIVDHILGRAVAPGDADCTTDGTVDVRDVVCVLNSLTPAILLTVTPDSVDLGAGQIQQFEAEVTGVADTRVTWAASGGQLTTSGNSAFLLAPVDAGSYTLVATSAAVPSLSSTAKIEVSGTPQIRFISDSAVTLGGSNLTADFEVEVIGADGQPISGASVDWESSNGALVSVTSTGSTTARAAVVGDDPGTGSAQVKASCTALGLEVTGSVAVVEPNPQTVFLSSDPVISVELYENAPNSCERTETRGAPEVLTEGNLTMLQPGDLLRFVIDRQKYAEEIIQGLSPDPSNFRQMLVLEVNPDGSVVIDELLPPAPAARITFRRTPSTESLETGHVMTTGDKAGVLMRVLSVQINADTVVVEAGLACLYEAFDSLKVDLTSDPLSVEILGTATKDSGTATVVTKSARGVVAASGEPVDLECNSAFSNAITLEPGIELSSDFIFETGAQLEVSPISCVDTEELCAFGYCVTICTASAGPSVDLFSLYAVGALSANLKTNDFRINNVLVGGECVINMPALQTPPVNLGPIPLALMVEPGFGVLAAVQYNSENAFVTGPEATVGATTRTGIYFENGEWSSIGDFEPTFEYKALTHQASVGARLEGFMKLDVGLAVPTPWKPDVNWAETKFVRLSLGSYGEFRLPIPGDPDNTAYLGPEWEIGQVAKADLQPELSGGVMKEILALSGKNLTTKMPRPINLYTWQHPSLRSPKPLLSNLQIIEAGSADGILDLGLDEQVQLVMTVPDTLPSLDGEWSDVPVAPLWGDAQFVVEVDGAYAGIGRQTISGSFASYTWAPDPGYAGTRKLSVRAPADGVFPYAPDLGPNGEDLALELTIVRPVIQVAEGQSIAEGAGGTAAGKISVTNAGESPLVISGITSSGLAIDASFPITVEPAASVEVDASAACAHRLYDSTLTITSNDPVDQDLEVPVGVRCDVPADDLVHRWSFNGSLTDSSGGATAVLVGDPKLSASDVAFDGVNDSLSLPIGPTIGTLSDATFEAWVTWDENQGAGGHVFDFGTNNDLAVVTANLVGNPAFTGGATGWNLSRGGSLAHSASDGHLTSSGSAEVSHLVDDVIDIPDGRFDTGVGSWDLVAGDTLEFESELEGSGHDHDLAIGGSGRVTHNLPDPAMISQCVDLSNVSTKRGTMAYQASVMAVDYLPAEGFITIAFFEEADCGGDLFQEHNETGSGEQGLWIHLGGETAPLTAEAQSMQVLLGISGGGVFPGPGTSLFDEVVMESRRDPAVIRTCVDLSAFEQPQLELGVASSFKPVDYQAQQCGIDLGYFAESGCTTALGSHEINSESSLSLGEWGRVEGSGVTEVGTRSASVSLRCQGVNAVTTRFDDSSLTVTPLPDNVLRFSPRAGNGLPRFAINGGSDPADEEAIEGVSAFPIGTQTHVAVTLDSSACAVLPGCSEIVGTLYVNGIAVGSNPAMSVVPSDLGSTPHNFLGRSLLEDADVPVFFDGSIDEFRIYDQALTADEIAVTFADGQDEP